MLNKGDAYSWLRKGSIARMEFIEKGIFEKVFFQICLVTQVD